MNRTIQPAMFWAAAVSLAIGGCAPDYGTVEFGAVSTPPTPVTIRSNFIEMPVGIGAVVRADPVSDNVNDYDSSYKLDLFSRDRGVFRVHRRANRREFVFVGIAEGSTCLQVEIDGRPHECIDVEITPPEGG